MRLSILLSMALLLMLATTSSVSAFSGSVNSEGWVDSFDLDKCEFSSTGKNSYFFLQPGYQLVLEGEEDGEAVQLIVTVLNETKVVDGIETRVVEERETEGGELIEVSRNYFALCSPDNDIFYFGEDVDIYEDGEIVSHEGGWLAGVGDAKHGVIIPAKPEVGLKYYQEVAPGVAEDRAEIISLNEVLDTPAGKFENVLKVEETTPLEPGVREYKFHAPGIGLIQDEDLKLVKYVLPKADMNGKGDVEKMRMERRQEIVAKESGEQIHQRHMEAAPASPGKYSPGLNYTLKATGTATGVQGESRDVSLTMDVSVWKSNGAVLILDVVGGTVRIGDETHDIELGYALYSIQHNIFRSSALVTADNGDVFVLKLRGSAEMATEGIELPTTSEGDPVELKFDEDNMGKNSLDGWKLTLNGTLEA